MCSCCRSTRVCPTGTHHHEALSHPLSCPCESALHPAVERSHLSFGLPLTSALFPFFLQPLPACGLAYKTLIGIHFRDNICLSAGSTEHCGSSRGLDTANGSNRRPRSSAKAGRADPTDGLPPEQLLLRVPGRGAQEEPWSRGDTLVVTLTEMLSIHPVSRSCRVRVGLRVE